MRAPRSLADRRVLVDSAAYFAITAEQSSDHAGAAAVMASLAAQNRHMVTTNFIVAETHALVLRHLGRDVAALTLERLYSSDTTIVRVKKADEQRAREIIATYDDKDFTLTDATSFAVMERFGISTAFTFDRHFMQYGFTVLGLDEPQ